MVDREDHLRAPQQLARGQAAPQARASCCLRQRGVHAVSCEARGSGEPSRASVEWRGPMRTPYLLLPSPLQCRFPLTLVQTGAQAGAKPPGSANRHASTFQLLAPLAFALPATTRRPSPPLKVRGYPRAAQRYPPSFPCYQLRSLRSPPSSRQRLPCVPGPENTRGSCSLAGQRRTRATRSSHLAAEGVGLCNLIWVGDGALSRRCGR